MSSSNSLMALLQHANAWCVSYAALLLMFALAALIERQRPVQQLQPRAAIRLNLLYSALYSVVAMAIKPVTTACSVQLVNAAGGGLVALRSDGWGALASVVVLLLAFDLLEYVFHRLQHAIPLLWQMHSLHHSAQSFNATITLRHFWLEPLIKGCLLYPIAGILFKADPKLVALASLLFVPGNFFAHMNFHVPLGRFVTWINNPQYHRLHHSCRPEHFDRNFAQLLPLWDHLFGTMWAPSAHEWPPTGLSSGEEPTSLMQAIAWPLHERRAMRAERATLSAHDHAAPLP
jgi:sterol desaturase/sphingolipid hydroxylase (fatty acid hydroxylase superfamily)